MKKKSKTLRKSTTRSTQQAEIQQQAADALADDTPTPATSVTIAAIGASAGGLEAFTQMLHGLTPDTGVSLVLIQHLAQSSGGLQPLLDRHAAMPLIIVEDQAPIEPNRIYICPPHRHVTLADGRFHVHKFTDKRQQLHAIDDLLSSVASQCGPRGIGVILSGTGADGANGIRDIKAGGGITIAQAPESAKFSAMPQAAITTGMVDLILTPEQIGTELTHIASHPLVRAVRPRHAGDELIFTDEQLEEIFDLLRRSCGVDFSQYKAPTIRRRLQRRMVLHKIDSVAAYVKLLHSKPAELQDLYRDILIHVTRFFREPESFVTLNEKVFPRLMETREGDQPIRIWVAGCSTGEDA